MLDGFRIVCVTPAGRRRYMRLLVPQILSEDIVDEYQIWMNTEEQSDLLFLNELGRIPKVKLVPQPSGVVDGAFSICEFFAGCVDPKAIFAFYSQRDYLDKADLLEGYLEQVANAAWIDARLRDAVERAFSHVEKSAGPDAKESREVAAKSSALSRFTASLRFPYLRLRVEWMGSADYKRRMARKIRNWPLIGSRDV
ncbi:hypothetical protein F2P47_02460 [Parvibaculum sedimenti]|uniref:Uncharacterized protein n=1 Tax=Parvibaculum sedimenti TaxID=2608632 RepID=A0A6N6VKD8_9HYPH|nr:hypothetical protein [Parvibaculum sedimenti]KAB7742155.1 hypothetical protein F2P47_02460 [Parvibaculum sedimenti]